MYLALLGLGAVGALAVYLLLIAFVPGASGTRLDAMKTALLVVAGSGAGAGLYVQYRKQQTDEVKSALDHANSRRDQDKLFTERYTAAAAQLGHDKAAVRLAGVYAMARIADDSVRDRPTCLEVLCAYLRMPYNPDDPAAEPAERQVRITAQTAITARLFPSHPGFWADAEIDLTGAYLLDWGLNGATVRVFTATDATFSQGAKFLGVKFTREGRFSGATFDGYASFTSAKFDGNARFGGTTFSAEAWFGNVSFGGPNTTFNGAVFSGEARFENAAFGGLAGFDKVTFSEAAEFAGATFSGETSFDEAVFGGATTFDKAVFSRARPPVWPDGFAEPAGIMWDPAHPPAPTSGPDPNPPADPIDPAMDGLFPGT